MQLLFASAQKLFTIESLFSHVDEICQLAVLWWISWWSFCSAEPWALWAFKRCILQQCLHRWDLAWRRFSWHIIAITSRCVQMLLKMDARGKNFEGYMSWHELTPRFCSYYLQKTTQNTSIQTLKPLQFYSEVTALRVWTLASILWIGRARLINAVRTESAHTLFALTNGNPRK